MPASPPTASPPAEAGALAWFFGYGSLMWRPGFAHDAFEPARLDGWHRALCVYSHHYRGTAARPGLVLGLAPGGSCVGRAFGVEQARENEVVSYLDDRELLNTYVYDRRRLPLTLLRTGEVVEAWCYVAKPEHEQFAGGLDEAAVLACVRQGQGSAGTCAEYVRNTVEHLREMGIREPGLERLVEGLTEGGTVQ
jgi:glutathione-specific gamma-glutamylcyclotransferase